MKIGIILGATRPERKTERLAKWVLRNTENQPDVEAELIDLVDYPMPFFDEVASPRFNPDRKPDETVAKWLKKLDGFDAVIFVTPEYNHAPSAVLKNAIDYVDWQLNHKPVTLVAHGSVGGARAIVILKEVLSESRAVPIPDAVAFVAGRVGEVISEDGELNADIKAIPHGPQTALDNLLKELIWYANALKTAREKDNS